jgi:hypothetical protein
MTSPLPVANRILCLLARKDRTFAELVGLMPDVAPKSLVTQIELLRGLRMVDMYRSHRKDGLLTTLLDRRLL